MTMRVNHCLYLLGLILGFLSCHVFCGTVYKTILQDGTGPVPQVNQTVIVHYTGTLQSGVKFDSSHDRKEPFKFKLGVGEVIRGWDAGVSSMKVGERARLEIAPEDAYGAEGLPPVIPPSAKLIFDIELLGIDGVPPPQVQTVPVPMPDPIQPLGQPQFGNQLPQQPAQQGFQNPPDFTQLQGQTFTGGQLSSGSGGQGQIFTPPDLPSGQQFRGSSIRQDQVFSPTQQQQPPPQTFGGNQAFSTNPPGGFQTFGSQSTGFQNNPGQQFGSGGQGQTFQPPSFVGNNQVMSGQSIGQGGSQGFQPQPIQRSNPPIQSGFQGQGQQSSFQAPSLDRSRSASIPQQAGQNFNNFNNNNNFQGFQPPSGRQNLPPPTPPPFDSQSNFLGSRGITSQPNKNFISQPNIDAFPSRRFEQNPPNLRADTTRSRVPDLGALDRQSIDLRPFPGTSGDPSSFRRRSSFTSSRDRSMPSGVEFSGSSRSSRFDSGLTRDFTDRRAMDRIDPGLSRGELGLDPAFPDMFSERDFRTGSRSMGRSGPDVFRPRDSFQRSSFRSRDPGFDRFMRGGRGFPGIDRRRMFEMMARRGRMRPRF